MKKGVRHVIAVLAAVILLAAAFIVYNRRHTTSPLEVVPAAGGRSSTGGRTSTGGTAARAGQPMTPGSGSLPVTPGSGSPPVTPGSGSPPVTPESGSPPVTAGSAGRQDLRRLGISGMPSQGGPQGLLVTGFLPSSGPSPLAIIGVRAGDVIVSCNGGTREMGRRLMAAIQGLQDRGETIALVVIRGGEQLRLERTERLPDAETGKGT